MTDKKEDVECVTIPKQLLQTIYLDYLMFDNTYITDLQEEAMKMKDGTYWQPNENGETHEIVEKIKFYLEQG